MPSSRNSAKSSESTLLASRAVLRQIEPGNSALCTRCDEPIKFQAAKKAQRVIANVYENGVWDRVEHYHPACYTDAGEPYGAPAVGKRKDYVK